MPRVEVGFVAPKAKLVPMSWLIRLCEGTRFSHAYIKVESKSLSRALVYQATGSGVYFIGETAFNDHYNLVEQYEFEVSDEAKTKLLQWAIDTSGKPYGIRQVIGLALQRACRLVGIKIRNPFANGSQAYVCTELVANALEELGMDIGMSLDEVGLVELAEYVRQAYTLQKG